MREVWLAISSHSINLDSSILHMSLPTHNSFYQKKKKFLKENWLKEGEKEDLVLLIVALHQSEMLASEVESLLSQVTHL